jgi:hypothetical protein
MLNLTSLLTCARPFGRWAACRSAQAWSTSSLAIRSAMLRVGAPDPCRLPAPVPLPVRLPRLTGWVALPALLLATLAASPALAAGGTGYESTADGRLVDVQVKVGGQIMPLYFPRDGSERRYFQAFKGRNYSLVVTNNTGRRIGVLIAVDGLNVVNGLHSRLSSNEPMYVLDPWERTEIQGWRSSLQNVRRFVFVDEERSYAERTGQANGDLGWVRVMAFNERGGRWFDGSPGRINRRGSGEDEVRPYGTLDGQRDSAPMTRQDRAEESPARNQEGEGLKSKEGATPLYGYGPEIAPAPQSSVPGTGWGEKQWDPVRRVWFVPERHATDQIVLRYEYASGLRALGIFPRQLRDRLWERERGELGFAQPPRW